jgi:hypothetical protein
VGTLFVLLLNVYKNYVRVEVYIYKLVAFSQSFDIRLIWISSRKVKAVYLPAAPMDEKRAGARDTKSALVDTGHVIPPPATQRRYWQRGSSTQKRWTRLVILFLVVLTFLWTKSRSPSCATHVQDGKYGALIGEYMKHGNRRPNGPLRGSKAEELFL